jgi:hypothetical protein
VILASDETKRWRIVAEAICRMALDNTSDLFLKQQVVGLDYEMLFANVSDDTLIRQSRQKQKMAPLKEKLANAKPDSDEEMALLAELFRWPSLEEWIAPSMVLERLQSMFIAMHQATGSFVLYVDHFHCLVGGEPDHYPIDASTLLKPALYHDRIQLIGACTLEQYRQHIERNAAIERCYQEICLPEAT